MEQTDFNISNVGSFNNKMVTLVVLKRKLLKFSQTWAVNIFNNHNPKRI